MTRLLLCLLLWVLPCLCAGQETCIRVTFFAATAETVCEINRMGGIKTYAAQCLGATQEVFRNSGIDNVKLEYVHSQRWDSLCWRTILSEEQQQENAAPIQDLNYLLLGAPAVEEERKNLHADLVVSLCNDSNPIGLLGVSSGAKRHPKLPQQIDIAAQSHYIAVRIGYNMAQTSVETFIHELGHCFGCGHADNQGFQQGPQTLPYSSGIQSTDSCSDAAAQQAFHAPSHIRVGHRTIMGYDARRNEAGDVNPNLCFALTKHPCFSHPGSDTLQVGTKRYKVGDKQHNNAKIIKNSAAQLTAKVPHGNDSYKRPVVLSPEYFERSEEGVFTHFYDSNLFAAQQSAPNVPDETAAASLLQPAGKSLWYSVTAPTDITLQILSASHSKGCLYIYRTQAGEPVSCALAGEYGNGTTVSPGVEVPAGETILIRMDTEQGGCGGIYEMAVTMSSKDGSIPLPEKPTDTRPGGQGGNGPAPAERDIPNLTFGDILLLLLMGGMLFGAIRIMVGRQQKSPKQAAHTPPRPPDSRYRPARSDKPIYAPAPKQAAAYAAKGTPKPYTLIISYPDGQKETTEIGIERLTGNGALNIGSNAENDIIIRDTSVSRRHAQLKLKPDGLQIKDLGSTNGISLPAVSIHLQANQGTLLKRGDLIILGNVKILIF